VDTLNIEHKNLYFLHAFGASGKPCMLEGADGKGIAFFEDRRYDRHLLFYFWHSAGGELVAQDFEDLGRLQEKYKNALEIWYINLTDADKKEKKNAKKLIKKFNLANDRIVFDVNGEAAAAVSLERFSTLVFVTRDNYVFKKTDREFDIHKIEDIVKAMIASPVHNRLVQELLVLSQVPRNLPPFAANSSIFRGKLFIKRGF
jgi:hypothetical protein